MRPRHVAALASVVAFAPLAAFANGTAPPVNDGATDAGIARGADAYEETCAICHAVPSRVMAGVPGDDPDTRAMWLDTFLTDQYAAEDDARHDIIAWLLSREN